jgi:hypothetical protein
MTILRADKDDRGIVRIGVIEDTIRRIDKTIPGTAKDMITGSRTIPLTPARRSKFSFRFTKSVKTTVAIHVPMSQLNRC